MTDRAIELAAAGGWVVLLLAMWAGRIAEWRRARQERRILVMLGGLVVEAAGKAVSGRRFVGKGAQVTGTTRFICDLGTFHVAVQWESEASQ